MNQVSIPKSSRTFCQPVFFNLNLLRSSLNNLRANRDLLRCQYIDAKPYSHLVIDNLFEPEILEWILQEFPAKNERDWNIWDTEHELKSTSKGIDNLGSVTQLFCQWLNSSEVIEEIKSITGFGDLVADPMYHGAGLHEMYRGGWLDIHGDFTKHYYLPLIRRLNILIYLNKNWSNNWGGNLILQDFKSDRKQASYEPYFNRTIIFPTTNKTLHGVPYKLTCPPERSRKLISIYYWSPVPMPFLMKAGTPLIWASDRKKMLGRYLSKIKLLFQ